MNRGFSIAEAMITLLIVSLAMAAMAPIMSKQIKREVQTQLPTVCYPDYAARDTNLEHTWEAKPVPGTGYLLASPNSNNSWSGLYINERIVLGWGTSAVGYGPIMYPVLSGDTYKTNNLNAIKFIPCRNN